MIKKHRAVERVGFDQLNVDSISKTLLNVKLLGKKSKNGYEYSDTALAQAVGLLEGAKVFLDHTEISDFGNVKPHSVRDYVGLAKGTYRASDGVFAKTVEVVKHWDEIEPIAVKHPQAIGMSIDAIVGVDLEKEGVIQEIYHIRSVDFVSDPATTRGIFESYNGDNEMTVEELKKQHKDVYESIVNSVTSDVTKNVTEAVTKSVTEKVTKSLQKQMEDSKKSRDTSILESCAKVKVTLSETELKIARNLEGEVLDEYLKTVKEQQENVDPLRGRGADNNKSLKVESLFVA